MKKFLKFVFALVAIGGICAVAYSYFQSKKEDDDFITEDDFSDEDDFAED